jgi:hypothetical protein
MKHVKLFEQFINEGYSDTVISEINKLVKEANNYFSKLVKLVESAGGSDETSAGAVIDPKDFKKMASKVEAALKRGIGDYNESETDSEDKMFYIATYMRMKGALSNNDAVKKLSKMSGAQFEDWAEFWEEQETNGDPIAGYHKSILNRANARQQRFGFGAGIGNRDYKSTASAFFIYLPVVPHPNGYGNIDHLSLENGSADGTTSYNLMKSSPDAYKRVINFNSEKEFEDIFKATLGNGTFLKLVEALNNVTLEIWLLDRFQAWKNEAPAREAARRAKNLLNIKKAEQAEFLAGAAIKTDNFSKNGTTITDEKAYSYKDFEKAAILFNTNSTPKGDEFTAIKSGPKLKGRYQGYIAYFEYEDGRWTGGYEDRRTLHTADMSLEEFISICY